MRPRSTATIGGSDPLALALAGDTIPDWLMYHQATTRGRVGVLDHVENPYVGDRNTNI